MCLMPMEVVTNPLYPFLSREDDGLLFIFYFHGFTIFVTKSLVISSGCQWPSLTASDCPKHRCFKSFYFLRVWVGHFLMSTGWNNTLIHNNIDSSHSSSWVTLDIQCNSLYSSKNDTSNSITCLAMNWLKIVNNITKLQIP